eukprot:TRINITY_DN5355_c0_g1_i1.p1 TRINITY_DN5355_c0_g1~~TRINITY_DN5355_c0_g1_i1.p1  ORF type:complete len:189 (+),score=81.60 TRINITY_DN5355_c0_g1_i1:49-567(+)
MIEEVLLTGNELAQQQEQERQGDAEVQDVKATPSHTLVEAMQESAEDMRRRIQTRVGVAMVGGCKTDIAVQHYANCFVIMVTMLPVPALVLKCHHDVSETGGLGGFRSEVLMGRDDPALSVVGRQLTEKISKSSRKHIMLYLGIKPALTEGDKARTTITDILAAIDAHKLWA